MNADGINGGEFFSTAQEGFLRVSRHKGRLLDYSAERDIGKGRRYIFKQEFKSECKTELKRRGGETD